jgi:hypothetical protein
LQRSLHLFICSFHAGRFFYALKKFCLSVSATCWLAQGCLEVNRVRKEIRYFDSMEMDENRKLVVFQWMKAVLNWVTDTSQVQRLV